MLLSLSISNQLSISISLLLLLLFLFLLRICLIDKFYFLIPFIMLIANTACMYAILLFRPEVRTALHVPQEPFYGHRWTLETPINYTRTRASLLEVYPKLLAKYRALIYNGDADACIPYIGNEQWTAGLGLPTQRPWHPWVVDKQVAGYATTYSVNNFTFLTIKAAGHMVPQYKPVQALDMLGRFLNNKEF